MNTDLANLRRKPACGSLHSSALRQTQQLSPPAFLRRLHKIRPMCPTRPRRPGHAEATWTEGPAPVDSECAASSGGCSQHRGCVSCMKQDLPVGG